MPPRLVVGHRFPWTLRLTPPLNAWGAETRSDSFGRVGAVASASLSAEVARAHVVRVPARSPPVRADLARRPWRSRKGARDRRAAPRVGGSAPSGRTAAAGGARPPAAGSL